jgi:hypothetical protein
MIRRNYLSLEKISPLCACDISYDAKTGEFILIMADESGMVKIQDLSLIIKEYNLKPIDITKNNFKRNPHRYM